MGPRRQCQPEHSNLYTDLEEVYCDLDRVVATMDLIAPEIPGGGPTLELMRGEAVGLETRRELEAGKARTA